MEFIVATMIVFAQGLEPSESLSAIAHHGDVRVDLVAAEPLVFDPVAMAWDEHGLLYVVENRGYPIGPKDGDASVGSVVTLHDDDNDGVYDRRVRFADGFDFPNGIMPWRGGVFVTDSPYLLYLKDTDGDGAADLREPVLEGFAPGGSTQLRVSHPTLGIDNWIYMTNGLSGGDVKVTKGDGTVVTMGASDLRYHPITGELETTAGRAQFGLTFDDAGNKFICSNRNHVQHVVLQPGDVNKNPYSPFRAVVNDIPVHGAAAKLYPISENKTTAYSHIGTFTAACGLVIYRGDGMPARYRGNSFVCDPTGNLVHRDVLNADGITFIAHRGEDEQESEFLASSDDWFRPVYLTNGPDGALYLCDMYRGTIEHPQYLPKDLAARTDFEPGKDRGRIYRISARDDGPREIDLAELRERPIPQLESRNGWKVDTAHRIILERGDESFHDSLIDLANSTDYAHVRTRAVNLARANESSSEGLTREDVAGMNPKDGQEALAVLRAMARDEGSFDPSKVAAILSHHRDDVWTKSVALSVAYGYAQPIANALVRVVDFEDEETYFALGEEIGHRQGPTGSAQLLNEDLLHVPGFNLSLFEGILSGLSKRKDSSIAPFDQLVHSSAEYVSLKSYLERIVHRWPEIAGGNSRLSQEHQLGSIKLLGFTDKSFALPTLLTLLTPRTAEAVQIATIEAVAHFDDVTVSGALLSQEAWSGLTPRSRETAVNTLLLRGPRIHSLFDSIEAGRISPGALTALQRSRLLRSGNKEIKARAQKLFSSPGGGRGEALAVFQPAVTMSGDVARGKDHFAKICISCHVFQGEGHDVGPDLSDIRAKSAETILLHIIDPNREVTSGYGACEVETMDGDTYVGILTSDAESGITLTQANAIQSTIARDNIAEVRTAPLSLMPEGLEEGMSHQDMADLIAFLRRDL